MSHTVIITQRAVQAVKTAMTGDTKFVSLAIALAGAIAGGWLF